MTNIQEITDIQNVHAQEYGTTRKEKYFFLSSLCRDLEFAIEMDYQTAKYFEDCDKMNEILKKYYSKKYGVEKFNTFKGWKEEGFKVKKGSKGFLFWSKPKKKEKVQEEQEQKEDTKNEKAKYYLSYLFSNLQVEPIEL